MLIKRDKKIWGFNNKFLRSMSIEDTEISFKNRQQTERELTLSKSCFYLIGLAEVKANTMQQQILDFSNQHHSRHDTFKIVKSAKEIVDNLGAVFKELELSRTYLLVKKVTDSLCGICTNLVFILEKQHKNSIKLTAQIEARKSLNLASLPILNQIEEAKQMLRFNKLKGVSLYNENYRRKIDDQAVLKQAVAEMAKKKKEEEKIDELSEKEFKKNLFQKMKKQLKQVEEDLYSPFPDEASTFMVFERKFLESFNYMSHVEDLENLLQFLEQSRLTGLQMISKIEDIDEISKMRLDSELIFKEANQKREERDQQLIRRLQAVIKQFLQKQQKNFEATITDLLKYKKQVQELQANKISIGIETTTKQLPIVKNIQKRLVENEKKFRFKEEQMEKLMSLKIERWEQQKNTLVTQIIKMKAQTKSLTIDLQESKKQNVKIINKLYQKSEKTEVPIKPDRKIKHPKQIAQQQQKTQTNQSMQSSAMNSMLIVPKVSRSSSLHGVRNEKINSSLTTPLQKSTFDEVDCQKETVNLGAETVILRGKKNFSTPEQQKQDRIKKEESRKQKAINVKTRDFSVQTEGGFKGSEDNEIRSQSQSAFKSKIPKSAKTQGVIMKQPTPKQISSTRIISNSQLKKSSRNIENIDNIDTNNNQSKRQFQTRQKPIDSNSSNNTSSSRLKKKQTFAQSLQIKGTRLQKSHRIQNQHYSIQNSNSNNQPQSTQYSNFGKLIIKTAQRKIRNLDFLHSSPIKEQYQISIAGGDVISFSNLSKDSGSDVTNTQARRRIVGVNPLKTISELEHIQLDFMRDKTNSLNQKSINFHHKSDHLYHGRAFTKIHPIEHENMTTADISIDLRFGKSHKHIHGKNKKLSRSFDSDKNTLQKRQSVHFSHDPAKYITDILSKDSSSEKREARQMQINQLKRKLKKTIDHKFILFEKPRTKDHDKLKKIYRKKAELGHLARKNASESPNYHELRKSLEKLPGINVKAIF